MAPVIVMNGGSNSSLRAIGGVGHRLDS